VRWGRYRLEVTDPDTGLALRYGFYAGYGAQDADDIGNRPDRVQLKLQARPSSRATSPSWPSSRRTTARPSSPWKATACCGPSASA
jgi:hypothetical protein